MNKKEYKWIDAFETCSYYSKEEFLWIYVMNGCGCGSSEKIEKLAWKVFELFFIDFDNRKFSLYDDLKYEIIAHWLDSIGLIEHGTSIGGSWLSEEGKELYQKLFNKFN